MPNNYIIVKEVEGGDELKRELYDIPRRKKMFLRRENPTLRQ